MYDNVAPHAWSPPTFPHIETQAKARLLNDSVWSLAPITTQSQPFAAPPETRLGFPK
jgi:hypothetical protein